MAVDWGSVGSGAMTGASMGAMLGGPMAPLMAVGGAMFGGIAGGFMGGGKKTAYEDPLAGIRQQLIQAAGGYAELGARQKAINAEMAKQMISEGNEDIMETARGERGFGANTIELDWKRNLLKSAYDAQTSADLSVDRNVHSGLISALQAAMGNPPTAVMDQGWSAGRQVGQAIQDTDWKGILKGLTPKKTATTDFNASNAFDEEFTRRTGSQIF